MKGLLLMITFLTRIPVKYPYEYDQKDFKQGIIWMPLVGAIIGVFLWSIILFEHYLDRPVVIFILWIGYIWITGGLHLDGLADSFDGLFSNRSKERILEIMKDSRIGSFGVVGLVFTLGFNLILSFYIRNQAIFVMPIVARGAALLACSISEYGRAGEGMGKAFVENCGTKEGIIGTAISGIIAFAFQGLVGVFTVFVVSFVTIQMTRYCKSKIGGMTGDTIGFTIELTQTAYLFTVYLLERMIV